METTPLYSVSNRLGEHALRYRDAARYARWAAMAAAAIALAVGGVYAERALPVTIGVTVQQQSAQFSFSKVEQNRTLFTVRASRATQYKDQSHALIEDVWITLYGRDGCRRPNRSLGATSDNRQINGFGHGFVTVVVGMQMVADVVGRADLPRVRWVLRSRVKIDDASYVPLVRIHWLCWVADLLSVTAITAESLRST
jgi:hypothetical protein